MPRQVIRPWAAMAAAAAVVLLGSCGGASHPPVAAAARIAPTTSTTATAPSTAAPTTAAPTTAPTTAAPTTQPASLSTTVAPPAACASTLAGRMASTGGGSQLVTVVASSTGSTMASVTLWQRTGACWASVGGPWSGWVGYNGLSADKHEGDGTSPIGVFGIGSTFYGNGPNPGVQGAYHPLVCGDWWDEDPESPEYNTFQHVACGTTPVFAVGSEGSGSEALWTETSAYQSFAFIEYNADPIIPGKGSAIFLHDNVGGPTDGCVSLAPSDLDTALRWLDPAKSPHVAIGTTGDIDQL